MKILNASFIISVLVGFNQIISQPTDQEKRQETGSTTEEKKTEELHEKTQSVFRAKVQEHIMRGMGVPYVVLHYNPQDNTQQSTKKLVYGARRSLHARHRQPQRQIITPYSTIDSDTKEELKSYTINTWKMRIAQQAGGKHPDEWDDEERRVLFESYSLYQFSEYRGMLKTFPEYERRIFELDKRFREDNAHERTFTKKVDKAVPGWTESESDSYTPELFSHSISAEVHKIEKEKFKKIEEDFKKYREKIAEIKERSWKQKLEQNYQGNLNKQDYQEIFFKEFVVQQQHLQQDHENAALRASIRIPLYFISDNFHKAKFKDLENKDVYVDKCGDEWHFKQKAFEEGYWEIKLSKSGQKLFSWVPGAEQGRIISKVVDRVIKDQLVKRAINTPTFADQFVSELQRQKNVAMRQGNTELATIYQQRLDAIKATQANDGALVTRTYELSPFTLELLLPLGIDVGKLQSFTGTAIQQQHHLEVVDFLNKNASVQSAFPELQTTQATQLALIAQDLNKQNKTEEAFGFLDWAKVVLYDFLTGQDNIVQHIQGTKQVDKLTLIKINKDLRHIRAVGRGIRNSIDGIQHMAAHPKETLMGAARLIKLAYDIGTAQITTDDVQLMQAIGEHLVKNCKWAMKSPENFLEASGGILTDVIIQGKALQIAGKVMPPAAELVKTVIAKGGKTTLQRLGPVGKEIAQTIGLATKHGLAEVKDGLTVIDKYSKVAKTGQKIHQAVERGIECASKGHQYLDKLKQAFIEQVSGTKLGCTLQKEGLPLGFIPQANVESVSYVMESGVKKFVDYSGSKWFKFGDKWYINPSSEFRRNLGWFVQKGNAQVIEAGEIFKDIDRLQEAIGIWSKIKATAPNIKYTMIPKRFILEVDGKFFEIVENVTEHFEEKLCMHHSLKYFSRSLTNVPAHHTKMAQSLFMQDFYDAIKIMTKDGIIYQEKLTYKNWKIVINNESTGPRIFHVEFF